MGSDIAYSIAPWDLACYKLFINIRLKKDSVAMSSIILETVAIVMKKKIYYFIINFIVSHVGHMIIES